ncbi:MAG: NAD(P)H-hydrate dehydratase [Acidimicrobiia bacterium]|nr:MAG: NAD(P)H-hydrate dehydratase [Acidimicrobiia bacterium]
MRPVITPAESARLDEAAGTPGRLLLERAGLAVALAAVRMGAGYGRRVAVLTGPGNNGGDGWVAARHLRRRGAEVVVHSLGYPRGDSSPRRAAAIAAVRSGVSVRLLGETNECDLIVDALFGSGFRGSLPTAVASWTGLEVPVLAVDLPSGLDGLTGEAQGPVFRASRTVTFHALKTGHLVGDGPDLCGEVEVADIGLGGEIPEWLLCEDADAGVPERPSRAHKWSAGSVAVVGGSPGIVGASVLAGGAALHFGAGSVRVLVPRGVGGLAAAMDPGLTTEAVGDAESFDDGDAPVVLERASRFDVMLLGPGLGPESGGFAESLMRGWPKPMVIDADALRMITPSMLAGRPAATVITPHAAEFTALTGEAAIPESAAGLASSTGAVVLLKGAPTFVMGTRRWVVTSGTRDLATIGTGDVLAGMVAALMARGMPPEDAARAAAHRHGRAGRRLAETTTVTAPRLMGEIGRWAW